MAYYLVIHPNQFFTNLYSDFTFWAGVDLFFAISGFVIMNSFLKTLSQKDINFWKACKIFWVKRVFRILPAAWFWLMIYLLLTYYFNATGAFGNISENLQDAKAAILQYANIYGVSCWGDGGQAQCGPNGIYWSLSLEEQFYILLPILVLVFRNYFKYFLIVASLCLFFVNRPEWSWGWALRTDAIMFGVLISIFNQSKK
ncbi:MAG: acyltransferase, partial [Pseudobdellovibrio sp.]